jgi:7-carboxy-7-deazaguanine synthase
MKINEVFHSIQGEGIFCGIPTVFIRTTGCNLRCSWCDTKYAYEDGKEMTVDEILKEVRSYPADHICLTGGEPLIQGNIGLLIRRLLNRGYNVSVETNGSISIRNLARTHRLMISMDIKCPSSGEQSKMLFGEIKHLSEVDQLKFVIETDGDYEYAKSVILKYRPRCSVIFQPVWGSEMKTLAGKILDDGLDVRLIPQLHKLIWGEKEIGI